jgi:hypothetical protein
MRKVMATVVVGGVLFGLAPSHWAHATRLAQATGTGEKSGGTAEKSSAGEKPAAAPHMTGRGAAASVKVRGTVEAMDKDKGTVMLKGPEGRTITLQVRDKQKLETVKVGDPVVATYTEAVAFQVKKQGTATPGVSTQESRVSSKPGETPAGAIGREITVTATITAIDKKAHTVTIKGPEGNTETIKAKDPKNLAVVKVGDLVEIVYAQALALSLDSPAKK